MNAAKLAIASVRRKPLGWAFHLLSLALGVAVVVALLAIDNGLDRRFSRDLGGIDLVVGAKGSPLQIILSSVFNLDVPTGNIPLSVLTRLQRNMLVRDAVPVSLGDNVAGYRIVGTSPDYEKLYDAKLAEGRWWNKPLQAVLGAEVARTQKLKVGDVFVGEHGLAGGGERHEHSPYQVVGILAPTGAVIDRLALTDTASVWKVHEHENAEHQAALAAETVEHEGSDNYPAVGQEVTSVLVRYRSAMGALMIPRLLKNEPNVQTAVPAVEMMRLNTLLGTGSTVLRGFGIGLLALSGIGFFVALLSAVQERQRELALLRALGSGPGLLFRLVLIEALMLGMTGGLLGLAIGRIAAEIAATIVARDGGPALALPPMGLTDLAIVVMAVLLAGLAALFPAFSAYLLRPAQVLRA
ncbi:ABC transporter permease [Novosphingobium sp. KACC 22771]|uniref:ABC transporter permease n=1 Tax=Novosphingobium sp. KACC 22771 TaxID=3025670 RepID=UPI0023659132|nr:ABC transporter permease [Novosphingobium sp. KACC 22771]WDF70916.1 ABC transporter permease [Novosphingobium sp. KACC 22771]